MAETFAPVYERDCPYFARHHGWLGHDPSATCAFGCVDEPNCVTGSWLDDDQFASLKAEFEATHNGRTETPEEPAGNGSDRA